MLETNVSAKYGDNRYDPIEERYILRPISKKIAKALLKTMVTPNMVSVAGFFILLIACFFIISPIPLNFLIAAIVLFVAIIFDKVDGDLARMRGTAGTKGQYIDGFLDVLGEVLLTISLAYGFGFDNLFFIGCAIAGPLLFNYHGISAPFYLNIPPAAHKNSGKKFSWKELFYYGRVKHFFLIIFSLIINAPFLPFFFFSLLVPYTLTLFLKNIFIKKTNKIT